MEPIDFNRFSDYLDDTVLAYHSAGGRRQLWIKGILLAFFAAMQSTIAIHIPPAHPESFKVAQARQWVRAHLAEASLSVKQLAQWIRCSPEYLSWLFHKETGTPLTHFINEQRLSHARYLLENSMLNISEIARASGYSDPGYFSRRFHQATGQSPKSYRRGLTLASPDSHGRHNLLS